MANRPRFDKQNPNKELNVLWKEYNELKKVEEADHYNWEAEKILKEKLRELHGRTGIVEALSKNNIIKLMRMQSNLRFVPALHVFYFPFVDACENLGL